MRLAVRPRLLVFFAAMGLLFLCRASMSAEPAPAPPAEPASTLRAILEIDREAYYAGDPVPVRVSIWNDGDSAVSAPGGEIPSGFELFDKDGKKLAAAGAAQDAAVKIPQGDERQTTKSLSPGAFFGYARDLTKLFPSLREVGTYRLQWSSGGLVSNAIILHVVTRYDPDKDYVARVETEMGVFTMDFLRKDAPIAVKTFVELAQSGFYDGLTFHYVEPGRVIASGDPTGTGKGGPGFSVPREHPQVKMLSGTVIMLPGGRPPANGSIFAILLAPRPDYEGAATGFAQVVEGLDVVKKISEAPASAREAPQPHKPLKPVKINRVIIKVKTA